MNTLFCRIALVAGCLSLSLSAMAYTSTDCTNVEQLASKGVVSYKNTCREYNLDRTITRQEVAAVTLKVGEICGSISNIPPQGQYMCDNIFSDVSSSYPNDWVCRVAETLARDGIISQNDQNAYGDVFFRPLKNITRAEALAMLMSGANLEYQGTTYDDWRFSGTGAVTWQKPLMQYAYDRDIISSITSFGPNTNAYRRDVFNYAIKAINLCETNGGNYNYNNNYTNNNCAIGQYASGNTCYSCGTLPWNAYYTSRGSCIWQCNSGYVKSGNTCVASGYNYGTTGQCGTSINSCVSGTFYDTTDYGNYAYWNCTGSNGTAVSCSAYTGGNYYGTTGQCGTSINSCVSGTFYDTTDYGNYAYWNCTGTNGTAVSCSAYNSGYNSNNCSVGQYWTGNMCLACTSKPSYSYYTNVGTCDWSCDSGYYRSGNTCVSNYNNTYCSAGQYLSGNTCYSCGTAPWNAYYTTAGSCDWSCNSGYYRSGNTCTTNYSSGTTGQCGYTAGSCTTGYASNTTYSGGYTYWNCTGTNGVAVSCNTWNNNYYGTTAQCGSTINSCISGTFYDTADSGSYAYWNCMGSNGNTVSCNAYNNNYYGYTTSGQCGTTRNSCITGTFVEVTDSVGYYNWYCNGTNGGYDQFCSVSTTYNNNYNSTPCCDKPKPLYNAYYTNNNGCWACNAGYRLSSDGYSCVY